MSDFFPNPMGLMGFEFVEFASPQPGVLEPLFEKMGFTEVARHRSKDVSLYRQGDINFIINREPQSVAGYFAAEHGPSACGLAFRVQDAHQAYKREPLKTYASKQRQEMLKALGFKDGIQRKAQKNKPLSACQQRRNKAIAKRRAKVEHVFAGIRHMGGKFLRCIGQVRASATMVLMAACYNLKRLASFLERGVDSFFKSKPSKTEVRLHAANR